MSQFCQLDLRWKNIIMGNITGPNPSTNSIGNYGCYLCSLVSGLSDRGYGWDPASFNLLLRANGAWVGPFEDYIDSANLPKYMPDVFVSYQRIDPWNDIPKVDNLVGESQIVVCRVNARAIGGTGTHYLYLVGQQKSVALIYDPWRNVIEPITVKYGNWGDILGIDIFTVRGKSTPPPAPPTAPPVVETPPNPTPTPEPAPEPSLPPTEQPAPPSPTPSVPTPVISKPNIFQRIVAFLKWLVS